MVLTPMRQTFTHRKLASSGIYGPVYADHLLQPCKFVRANKIILGPNNQDVVSTAFLRTSTEIESDDLIVFGAYTYQIASVLEVPGIGGGTIEWEIRLSGAVPTSGTPGEPTDMLKSTYDKDDDGIVDMAEAVRDLLDLPAAPTAGEIVLKNGKLYVAVESD